MRRSILAGAAALLVASLAPRAASAFCGFYVSGADAKLFNNATQVVLMREGQRTVLSMQNNYQGPPENFAMVVPVPVILQKENVKTLPKAVFERVDQLAAPRLVEYWEQDPCQQVVETKARAVMAPMAAGPAKASGRSGDDLGVTVEAQFTVGEYEVVILSAKDAGGLDAWLKQEKYKIPEGAEPYFKPYIQQGSKFFVAKVDVSKVKFETGMAMLSPLRFHYDSEKFNLPVRLGLMNANGTQDLIVHILAKQQRYEVANYPNVTIPTNLDVSEKARGEFGSFYAALFDRTMERNPKAVITEYAWDAGTCDPCPSPALNPGELATLGADALPSANPDPSPPAVPPSPPGVTPKTAPLAPTLGKPVAPGAPVRPMPIGRRGWFSTGFVLTRLHARYTKDSLGEDLVFKAAEPIAGGREFMGQNGKLEEGAVKGAGTNNFQGRYAMRHPWTGPVTCENPRRGIWGGPPPSVVGDARPKPALNLAFAPRGKLELASFVQKDVPEIGLKGAAPPNSGVGPVGHAGVGATPPPTSTATTAATATTETAPTTEPAPKKSGCSTGPVTDRPLAAVAATLGGLLALGLRRRSRVRP